MKDIFANLYNKVVSFFNQTDNKEDDTKDVACNRLKLVLMQDRTNLTPMIMDRMRKELVELLSKYLELDKELLDLSFEHEDNQMALMLSIPVIRAKNEDEILAILEEEDKKREEKEKSEEESEEESENKSEDESEEESGEKSNDEDKEEEEEEEDDDDDDDKDESDESEDEEEEIIIVKTDDSEVVNEEENEEENNNEIIDGPQEKNKEENKRKAKK